jgi:predicted AlkP superfamily pyrophosphatase or phosphodiesterase
MNRIYVLLLFLSFLSACTTDESITDYDCEPWTNTCSDITITVDSQKANRKVLIIGIDGFRADGMQESITPFLWSLAIDQNIYFTDQNHVQALTFSGPNWSSLCTGVDFCKHQVTTNGFGNNQLEDFPHFFSVIEEAAEQKNTVSLVNWTPINEHLAAAFADHAPEESINDHDVFLIAQNLLQNGYPLTPDVLFLQFDELDGTGHDFGFHPEVPEYASYLTVLDTYIDSLVGIVNSKRQNGEDWLVCIVSDHGGEGTGHGDQPDDEDVRHTIMFMESPTESFKHWYTSSQTDLAPTVLDYLGIESAAFNCRTDGVSVLQD